jgi:hypothetical protein
VDPPSQEGGGDRVEETLSRRFTHRVSSSPCSMLQTSMTMIHLVAGRTRSGL